MILGAVMVPHPPLAVHEVGKGEEEKISSTISSYHTAMKYLADLKPDTVIVFSPHAVMYRDWFNVSEGSSAYGDFANFRAGSVSFEVQYDEELTSALTRACEAEGFPAGTQYDREKWLDHGTMVPLYFLNQYTTDYKLVRIGLSGLPLPMHYQFGQILRKTVDDLGRRAVIIGSGDLSHCQKADGPYGYQEEGPQYDGMIMKTMGSAAFGELLEYDPVLLQKAQECGHRSFVIMAGMLDGTAVTPHVYSHEATFGVGYGIVTYEVGGADEGRHFLRDYLRKKQNEIEEKKEDPYVALARKAVDYWIQNKEMIRVTDDLPEEMRKQRAGTFVSLHEFGELRGCIGTIFPGYLNVAQEIIQNAISACSRDPRFSPVTPDELPFLEISVDVLGTPEVIGSRDELDVKRYGVICSDGVRKGLLLPDLEGVDTVDEQISIACRKAGIDEADDFTIERFEVIRHV